MDREKNGLNDEEATLLELFKRQFPEHPVTTAEERLLLEVQKGEVIDYSSDDSASNDPGDAEKWGSERTISASAIAWLCTDRVAASRVTHKGIQVRGAKVAESLDLSFADVPFPLGFLRSTFTESVSLRQSYIKAFNLQGSRTQSITADGMNVKGDVFLGDGFKAEGEVRLPGATIGGQLNCSKGHFINPDSHALSADGMDVKGDVLLGDGFKAEGEVRLPGATIGGQLNCSKGQFINPDGNALNADAIDVKSTVLLGNGFNAEGEVRLLNATIGGQLNCSKGHFINPDSHALSADGMDVKGDVFLGDGFNAEGEVRLLGAMIGGQLNCSKGQFINPDGNALNADEMNVKRSVLLSDGFNAEGEVRLLGATIGGQVNCSKGQFINPGGHALSADGIAVKGYVLLSDGFNAEGEIRLLDATIGGQLNCSKGHFINPNGDALSTDGMNVKGDVFLCDDFKAEGRVSLFSTVVAQGLKVTDALEPEKTRFDFTAATVDTLWDDENSWPVQGNLVLDGFVYRRLEQQAPHSVEARIRWLHLQPTDRFYPHPYEQLAKVLQESGYVDSAKKVLIAESKDPVKLNETRIPSS